MRQPYRYFLRFGMVAALLGFFSPGVREIRLPGGGVGYQVKVFAQAEARRGGRGGGMRSRPGGGVSRSRSFGGNFHRAPRPGGSRPKATRPVGKRPTQTRPVKGPSTRPASPPKRPTVKPGTGKPMPGQPGTRPPGVRPPGQRPPGARPPHGRPPHHPPHHGRPGWHGPAAIGMGIVIGTIVASLPPDCVNEVVDGTTYYRCHDTWYLPYYEGSVLKYRVVNAPR